MKTYNVCNGMVLDEEYINDQGCYEPYIHWWCKPTPTVFTPDEDDPDSSDNSVALFEKVYPKREFYLMLAFHRLKVFLLEEKESEYDDIVSEYRKENYFLNKVSKLNPDGPYHFFDELLVDIGLSGVAFGNEGELMFTFYDFANDRYIDLIGSEDGFNDCMIEVKSSDEDDLED